VVEIKKAFIIGLDASSPELVFNQFLNDLPNLKDMVQNSIYGSLKSCDPPITIPAWMTMMTGKSPGTLGLYGFRHKKPQSYTEFYIANSNSVKEKCVWDIISEKNLRSCVIGVPPSYPPKPINGELISCFITPDSTKNYTYPIELKQEIENLIGQYPFDVKFRTEDRDNLLKELYDMTKKHFKVIKHLVKTKKWHLFMAMEIGVDRIQHAFWKFFDETHKRYVPNHPYKDVIKDYYKYLDFEIGEITKLLDDDTTIFVVSDHGAKKMDGAFCINEWLIQEGWMNIDEKPKDIVELKGAKIDWTKTKAWGWGGYYARIFLNLKGRDPNGIIEQKDFEDERKQLTQALMDITDPDGRKMRMKVYTPEELYPVCRGDYPDLMVYFDDLYWRSAGTLGHDSIYLPENDTGPDDAMHAQDGLFLMYNKAGIYNQKKEKAEIIDIAPTVLQVMGQTIPHDIEGKALEA
jgi:predicted AlkP superfamily phosphohydrolase/phosphomutase